MTLPATTDPTFRQSVNRNPMNLQTEKLSHFRFYWHDNITGPNPTVVNIVQQPANKRTANTGFGMVNMNDDPLTEKPESGSKLIGRAQGLYALASREEIGVLMVQNLVFSIGKYNGSTLMIMGRASVPPNVYEMPVIGGSGVFRFARGYVDTSTRSLDWQTGNVVVEYNVYVLHY